MNWGWLGLFKRALEFADGQASEVSPPGRGRMRYNDGTKQFEISEDGGAYSPIGEVGEGGWTDDGAIVRLTTASDTVVIGAAAMSGSEKVRILGDVRIETSGGIGPGDLYLGSDLFFLNQGIPHKIECQPWPGFGNLGGEFIQISSGPGQDNNAGPTAGAGGRLRLFGGAGGDNTGGAGGGGGPIELTAGAGGDGSTDGVAGGDIDLIGGAGGSTTGATGNAGGGGSVVVAGGAAGVPAGGGLGKAGGNVDIDGGVGSAASGIVGGDGGGVTIDGGTGGAGDGSNDAGGGGAITITGGDGGAPGVDGGAGNDVTIDAGAGTGSKADGDIIIGNSKVRNLQFGNGVDMNQELHNLTANVARAFVIREASQPDDYMAVDTTTGSEHVKFCDATQDWDFSVLGQGDISIGGTGSSVGFMGAAPIARPNVTGALTAVTDANARAVLQSIIAALEAASGLGLVTDGTT